MKKFITFLACAIFSVTLFTSCHGVSPEADKAYMSELNLSAEQFINLKWIETIANKQGANIDVMVGPATSMWNVRR